MKVKRVETEQCAMWRCYARVTKVKMDNVMFTNYRVYNEWDMSLMCGNLHKKSIIIMSQQYMSMEA